MKKASLVVATLLAMIACTEDTRTFRLPTTPTSATPQTPPPPQPPAPPQPPPGQPPPPVASDFSRIDVGQTINRVIGDAPPECLGEPGWPCQYFRLTVAEGGTLTVSLRYVPDTQPAGRFGRQGVDVTLESPNRQVWAQVWTPTSSVLTAAVTSGQEYQIVLWYTFPRLEYELTVALQ
jgi:hypothetical protein